MGNGIPCRFWDFTDKQEPHLADQRACNLGKIRIKFNIGKCPHRSLGGGYDHLFRYTQIGDKEQPGFAHKSSDPHQCIKKGMGSACLMRHKENEPSSQIQGELGQ